MPYWLWCLTIGPVWLVLKTITVSMEWLTRDDYAEHVEALGMESRSRLRRPADPGDWY
jgi:hypothetical protein